MARAASRREQLLLQVCELRAVLHAVVWQSSTGGPAAAGAYSALLQHVHLQAID